MIEKTAIEIYQGSDGQTQIEVRKEGERSVKREIKHYHLGAVISVGYRVNSKQGTQSRIWATQRLKEYLIQGYSLNMQRFEQNASELEQALQLNMA